jgi:hypothetical protein
VALLSCGDPGAPSSSPGQPGPGQRVAADATVGDATGVAYALDAFAVQPPDGPWSSGPDGAAPIACDVDPASQCPPRPAPACVDPKVALVFGNVGCVSGVCSWIVARVDCSGENHLGRCIGGTGGPDASLPLDAGPGQRSGPCFLPAPAAATPPVVSCDADGGNDGGLCPPPRSQCLNSGSAYDWLVYYDNGECVSGQCVWQTNYHYCGNTGQGVCNGGACVSSITAPTAQ